MKKIRVDGCRECPFARAFGVEPKIPGHDDVYVVCSLAKTEQNKLFFNEEGDPKDFPDEGCAVLEDTLILTGPGSPPDPQMLIYGNPVDGFNYVGPFGDVEDASTYAEDHAVIRDQTWWSADLELPDVEVTPLRMKNVRYRLVQPNVFEHRRLYWTHDGEWVRDKDQARLYDERDHARAARKQAVHQSGLKDTKQIEIEEVPQ